MNTVYSFWFQQNGRILSDFLEKAEIPVDSGAGRSERALAAGGIGPERRLFAAQGAEEVEEGGAGRRARAGVVVVVRRRLDEAGEVAERRLCGPVDAVTVGVRVDLPVVARARIAGSSSSVRLPRSLTAPPPASR